MSHDPVRVEDTRSWLAKAMYDLESAHHAMKRKRPLTADAVFHCQQAAEKAMKAFLTWHDVPFRKTHVLEEIGLPCVQLDASLQLPIQAASPLTEYAWRFRYPGDPAAPPPEEARLALRLAEAVVQVILDRVPLEARPEIDEGDEDA